jgi:hypothetical protein
MVILLSTIGWVPYLRIASFEAANSGIELGFRQMRGDC